MLFYDPLKQGWIIKVFNVDASTQYVPLVLNLSMEVDPRVTVAPFIALTSSDFANMGAPADHFAVMCFGMLKVPLFVVAVMRCMLSLFSCWNFLLRR